MSKQLAVKPIVMAKQTVLANSISIRQGSRYFNDRICMTKWIIIFSGKNGTLAISATAGYTNCICLYNVHVITRKNFDKHSQNVRSHVHYAAAIRK